MCWPQRLPIIQCLRRKTSSLVVVIIVNNQQRQQQTTHDDDGNGGDDDDIVYLNPPPQPQQQQQKPTISGRLKLMEYAVRGKITIKRASEADHRFSCELQKNNNNNNDDDNVLLFPLELILYMYQYYRQPPRRGTVASQRPLTCEATSRHGSWHYALLQLPAR